MAKHVTFAYLGEIFAQVEREIKILSVRISIIFIVKKEEFISGKYRKLMGQI